MRQSPRLRPPAAAGFRADPAPLSGLYAVAYLLDPRDSEAAARFEFTPRISVEARDDILRYAAARLAGESGPSTADEPARAIYVLP